MQIDDALPGDTAVGKQHEKSDHRAHDPTVALFPHGCRTARAAADPSGVSQRYLIREALQAQMRQQPHGPAPGCGARCRAARHTSSDSAVTAKNTSSSVPPEVTFSFSSWGLPVATSSP